MEKNEIKWLLIGLGIGIAIFLIYNFVGFGSSGLDPNYIDTEFIPPDVQSIG